MQEPCWSKSHRYSNCVYAGFLLSDTIDELAAMYFVGIRVSDNHIFKEEKLKSQTVGNREDIAEKSC